MRRLKTIFACLLMAIFSVGQVWATDPTISWDFKTLQTTSGTQSGITWETGKTGSATATACNSTNGLVLYGVTSGGGYFQTTSAISGTITNVNIVSTAKKNTPKYTVYCSTDGSTWDEIAAAQTAGTKDHAVTGSYTYVKVANTTAATAQLGVASITVTYTAGSTPSLSVSPAVIDFGTVEQGASVSSEAVAVTFSNLTGAVTYGGLSSPFTASGSVSATGDEITIAANTANVGNYSQTLTVQSTADSKSAEVTVKMNVVEPFDGLKLTFDFVTHPEGWPAAKASAAAGNYVYTISATDYTFAHSKVGDGIYCGGTSGSSGYLMIAKSNSLGLPAISGYKLVKVEGTLNNSGTPSTKAEITITNGTDEVTGGASQTWDEKGVAKTYNLSGTVANTMYYLNVSGTANLQMITLVLYYEEAEAPTVAAPTISGETPFLSSTEVTLIQNDADAIYYTTNGDAPTTSSTTYTAPFELTATATVKAIAVKGGVSSAVAEKTFTKATVLTVAEAKAAIAAAGSTPIENQYVTGIISQIDGYDGTHHSITYWISADGTTTDQLEVYSGKGLNGADFAGLSDLSLGDEVIVKGTLKNYKGTDEFDMNSQIIQLNRTIAAPTFTPDGGGFLNTLNVALASATEGAEVRYTVDGSDPTSTSALYSEPIELSSTTTIKATAFKDEFVSVIVSRTFTKGTKKTVAEALAALDSSSPIENQFVYGKVSTAPTSNPNSGRLTYKISDDGAAVDELEVYNGYGLNGAAFADKTDLQVGDEVTVFGTLKIYNEKKEFDGGNYLLEFNRPVIPTITADPAEVTNVLAEGVTNQTIALTYENIENYLVDVTLHDDAEGTEAFSDTWLTASVSDADNYATITYSVAANEGAARTAYMKVYAIGDDDKEATKIIAVSQEAYVAPALPASLPFAFDGGRADIATTQGMSQEGLDTDYASSPLLKFKAEGAWVIIEIASAPGKLTYDIKGNSFSGGTFKVQESANGVAYTDVATYTELGNTQSEEQTLLQATRFVKFIYTNKVNGNVALGNIAIAAPVAVETPTFSPAGGEYEGEQTVTISCETVGSTIYYTTDGTDPTNESTQYTSAITVDESKTIKAIAYKGGDHSEIASASYTITPALTDYYEKVSSGDVAEGTYLIVYEAGNVAFNGGLETLDAASNTIDVEITNDHKIGVTPATAAATFYIDPTAGTIKSASGRYIGRTANTNGLNASETEAYTNTISIDGEGNAVIVGSGSTATYLRYNPSQGQTRFRYFTQNQQMIALYKLANEVIKPASGLAWDPADDIELTVGDALSAPALLNPNSIPASDITIESSNTDVATVSEGVVSLVENGIGTTTISATYTGETYKPITVSYKIKVNPAYSIYVQPSLNVNFGSVNQNAEVADKSITVTLTGVDAATLTLEGTGASAFTISPAAALTASGDIAISASSANLGTFAATLTISDDAGNAESKVVNLSFSVTEPAGEETPVATDSKWVPATEIADGMQVLITGVKSDDVYAMGEQKNNNRAAVAASVDGEGVLTPGENTMAFTLVAQGDGTYALRTSNGKYLYAAASGSNYLKTQDEVDVNAKWTMTVASASAEGSSNRHVMQFNTGSTLFSCYASAGGSGMAAIKLYVPKPAPAPAYTEVRSGLQVGRHYTICLEKNVTAVNGATFWNMSKRNIGATVAYLEEATSIEAGKPYIFQATATVLEVIYGEDEVDDPVENGALRGTFIAMDQSAINAAASAAASEIYMLYNNELLRADNMTGNSFPANRAYVLYDAFVVVDDTPAPAPGRRVKAMPMQPQEATGLDNIFDINADGAQKLILNGQLIIIREGKMYDTTGRVVK